MPRRSLPVSAARTLRGSLIPCHGRSQRAAAAAFRALGLLPGEESLQRLVTAVLVEIPEARESGKSYLKPTR